MSAQITGPLLTDIARLEDRIADFERFTERVARLNPYAGEIGAGMLMTLVMEARNTLNPNGIGDLSGIPFPFAQGAA